MRLNPVPVRIAFHQHRRVSPKGNGTAAELDSITSRLYALSRFMPIVAVGPVGFDREIRPGDRTIASGETTVRHGSLPRGAIHTHLSHRKAAALLSDDRTADSKMDGKKVRNSEVRMIRAERYARFHPDRCSPETQREDFPTNQPRDGGHEDNPRTRHRLCHLEPQSKGKQPATRESFFGRNAQQPIGQIRGDSHTNDVGEHSSVNFTNRHPLIPLT